MIPNIICFRCQLTKYLPLCSMRQNGMQKYEKVDKLKSQDNQRKVDFSFSWFSRGIKQFSQEGDLTYLFFPCGTLFLSLSKNIFCLCKFEVFPNLNFPSRQLPDIVEDDFIRYLTPVPGQV